MRDNLLTLLFACILGIICAALLTTVSQFTKPFREVNEEAERVLNFLTALDVPIENSLDTKTLLQVFDEKIEEKMMGNLTIYEYKETDSEDSLTKAIAIPFSGPGLWGPIKGVVAFESDLKTIKGIRFYQHEETPGLGGEISAEWFQNQFTLKQIVSEAGDPGIKILKPGGTTDINSVDGITGATMTSDKVESILDTLAKEIWKERLNYAGE